MHMIFRDYRPESTDAESVIRLRRATAPHVVAVPASVSVGMATANPAGKYRLLLAEDPDTHEVVGSLHAGLHYMSAEPGHAFGVPHVHPDYRGRGIGSELLRRAEAYLTGLGVTTLHTWAVAEQDRAFAEKRGWSPGHAVHHQRLDLAHATLPEPPALPAGFSLCSAADISDDPRPLFEADAAAALIEPGSVTAVLDDYEDWLNGAWSAPLLDHGLTSLVRTEDGRVAAFAMADTDRGTRYSSNFTGVRKEFQGLGLAKAVKSDSLGRARAAGYEEAFTTNDQENGPMLAVNTWFGYEHFATDVEYTRALGDAPVDAGA
jgi:GNAT superfamily N-acetyltransferase